MLIDEKFKSKKGKYIFQCSLATIAILIVLAFLDVLNETAIIASLGATVFIIFTMPHSYLARNKCVFGGYLISMVIGILCRLILDSFLFGIPIMDKTMLVVFGSIAVGFSTFMMVLTDTEHAPAAGIALGLVINEWDYLTLLFIILAVTLFVFVKSLLKSFMVDLV
jgi:CBS-domain-containing membrane protein